VIYLWKVSFFFSQHGEAAIVCVRRNGVTRFEARKAQRISGTPRRHGTARKWIIDRFTHLYKQNDLRQQAAVLIAISIA
jgi:hypothetical protein